MGSASLRGYTITDDPAAVDRDRLFEWLTTDAYWWNGGLSRGVLDTALETSLCFSAVSPVGEFIGFGRMVTDRATFAYWCDVYVMPAHRGRGLGRQLTRTAVEHPSLATCRRIMLATRDAHLVYEELGFRPLHDPSWFMEVSRPSAAGAEAARVDAPGPRLSG